MTELNKLRHIFPGISLPLELKSHYNNTPNAGAFSILKLQPGKSNFSIRPYQKGDPIKFTDWYAFARTNKLFTREKKQSTRRGVHIYIDWSDSMEFPKDPILSKRVNKRELATRVGFYLAYEYCQLGEQISISILKNNKCWQIIEKSSDRKIILSHFKSFLQQKFIVNLEGKFISKKIVVSSSHWTILFSDGLSEESFIEKQFLKKGNGVFFHSLSYLETNFNWIKNNYGLYINSEDNLTLSGYAFKKKLPEIEEGIHSWQEDLKKKVKKLGWRYMVINDEMSLARFLVSLNIN